MENKDIIQDKTNTVETTEKINIIIKVNNSNEFLNNKREREENDLNHQINVKTNNESITSRIEKHIQSLTNCKECGKEKSKQINDNTEFFSFLNKKILKNPIDKVNIKKLYGNISIKNLCEECLSKELLIGGVNNLLKKINNDIDDLSISLSQIFINSFMKRLDDLNKSMIKNIVETEEVMNKMTLHLMLSKNKIQFQQFNEDMIICKNLLNIIREAYLNLYKSIFEENDILKKTLNNINNPQNQIKFEKLIYLIKDINKSYIINKKNNNNKIDNLLNNILFQNKLKSQLLFPPNFDNNYNPLNSFQFSKDANNTLITNNLFQSINNNISLEYPDLIFNNNNIIPPTHDSLNNIPYPNDFNMHSNCSDNLPLNQFNQFYNMENLLFPVQKFEKNNIQNNFNHIRNLPQEKSNFYYDFNNIINAPNNLVQNYCDGNRNQNNKKINENKTGNSNNMLNELTKQEVKENNNTPNDSKDNNQK